MDLADRSPVDQNTLEQARNCAKDQQGLGGSYLKAHIVLMIASLSRQTIGIAAIALIGFPALADPLNPEEFDAYTRGKTLTYGFGGQAYGAEVYRDNRRVTWSFLDGECKDGTWYPQDGLICFVYDDPDDPQCWQFFLEPQGLRALFRGQDGETELYEAGERPQGLLCYGPEVGV